MKQLDDNKATRTHCVRVNKLVPLDNEYDYTIFVRAICSYLQLRDERFNVYFTGIPTHHNNVLPDLLKHACHSPSLRENSAVSSRLQKKNRVR